METNEVLVRRLYDHDPEIQPWDGDPFTYAEVLNWANSPRLKAAQERAAIAVSVLSGERSMDGVPITEQKIEEWADEAEEGYSLESLRRGALPDEARPLHHQGDGQ